MKPGQAQLISIIGQVSPTFSAITQLSPGVTYSEITLEQTKKSMSDGCNPDISKAFKTASAPRSSRCSSVITCRDLMPVRVTIHSSLVSRNSASISFVTTFLGSALPVPIIFMIVLCFYSCLYCDSGYRCPGFILNKNRKSLSEGKKYVANRPSVMFTARRWGDFS